MPNTLTKTILPGTPAIPGTDGTPGSPGTPGTSAYCVTVPGALTYPFRIVIGDDGVFRFIYGDSVIGPSTQVCYPATYATPPIPATPGTTGTPAGVVNFNFGWNAGARSVVSLAASISGAASFSVPFGVISAVVGLVHTEPLHMRDEVVHGFLFINGVFVVLESGVSRTGSAAYTTTNVFSIVRSGSVVRYFKDSTLLYTSTVPSYAAVWLDGSLYAGGDSITNAALGTATTTPNTGRGAQSFLPLVSIGGIVAQAGGVAAFLPLLSASTGYRQQGCSSTFQPLESISSKSKYSSCSASFEALTSFATENERPAKFALHSAYMCAPISWGRAYAGSISVRPRDSAGDNKQSWTEGQWTGYTATITAGTGSGQSKVIAANNAQQLFFGSNWSTVPDATSVYTIT